MEEKRLLKVMYNKLKQYSSGKLKFTPVMNIMMNNHSKDWYAELGKYITEVLDISKIPYLSFFEDKLKEKKGIVTKIKKFNFDSKTRTYSSIAISFISGVLDEKALKNMFGEPILHSEFGEGFDGEYDEEEDEYGEPENKESYASYFVTVNDLDFHIGYDHRGTSIEIGLSFSMSAGNAEKCLDSLKKLVDIYKEKNL